MNLDELTQLEDSSVFRFEKISTRPAEAFDAHVYSLTCGVSPDILVITRNGFTVFDILYNVGGFLSVMNTIIGLVLSILNDKHIESYMVSHLFRISSYDASGYVE